MRRGDRILAESLRKSGFSYAEIGQKIKVSKSVLSYWLGNMPLNDEQILLLKNRSLEKRIERYRITMRNKKQIHLTH